MLKCVSFAKLKIKAFSLLPVMMEQAVTGADWGLFLYSSYLGSLGGGRSLEERLGGDKFILSFSPKWNPGSSHEPWEAGFTELTGDGTWGHQFGPPAQTCLDQHSRGRDGAPGNVPPPRPSKAKSLSVKFPTPERRVGRGCFGQCSG